LGLGSRKIAILPLVSPSVEPKRANQKPSIPYEFFILFGLLGAVIIRLSLGIGIGTSNFSYTLDDPLIHLRLAQEISYGHYGINGSEFSSPSSSVLWPFLLVPTIRTSFAVLTPLLINVVCYFALLVLALRTFREGRLANLKVAILVLGANATGLVFTGMEHSLQLLLSVACAAGLLQERKTGRAESWWIGALMLAPLIRYENLGITLAIAVYLVVRGHVRQAGVVLAVVCVGLGGFSLFLHRLGLGWLPSSVMAKSAATHASAMQILFLFPWNAIQFSRVLVLFEASLVVAIFCADRTDRKIGWVALVALIAHLVVGKYGWYDRYEAYLNGFLLTLAMGRPLKIEFSKQEILGSSALLAATIFGYFVGVSYLHRAEWAPEDARRIALQQLQMHRFVEEYWKGPVAVNDLGWVSWNNPNYVLDLWGLGNPEALRLRLRSKNALWMDALCREHGVSLCMIYQNWFHKLPANWCPVGQLIREGGPERNVVLFCVTNRKDVARAGREMKEFSFHLPKGAWIEVFPTRGS
jgi:hypothetical protein